VKRIRVTGHHPERLPGLRFLAARTRKGAFYSLLAAAGRFVSRSFGLGDTFEIYAIRDESLGPGMGSGSGSDETLSDSRARRGAIRGKNGT
jgi:hypothetical protein